MYTKVKRLLALLIDVYISFIIILVFIAIRYIFPGLVNDLWLFSNIAYSAGLLYLLTRDLWFKDASIGKKIVGLKVVTVNSERPSIILVLLRNVGVLFFGILFSAPLTALVMLLFGYSISGLIFFIIYLLLFAEVILVLVKNIKLMDFILKLRVTGK